MSNNYHNVSKLDTTKILQCGKKHVMSIALLSMTTIPCQGMELAWSFFSNAAPVVGMMVPESVKNTVSGYANTIYGESKDFDNQFNEFTANRCITELKDLVERDLTRIEDRARTLSRYSKDGDMKNGDVFDFNIVDLCRISEIARNCLLRYYLSLLCLDYTDQCKKLLEKKIEEVLEIKSQQQNRNSEILIDLSANKNQEELLTIDSILEYLEEIKLNLGAALSSRYSYTRKGGPVDRYKKHTTVADKRYKYWGVYTLPNLKIAPPDSKIQSIIDSETPISNCVRKTIEIYKTTFDFILESTDIKIINCDDPYEAITKYKEQYRKLFNKDSSNIDLTSKLVDAYNPIRDIVRITNTTTISSSQSTTESIPIPRRNSGEKSSSHSQSYSLGDASSVPANFSDALNRYNNTSTSTNPSSDYDISSIAHNKQLSLPKSPSIPKEVKVLEPIPQPEIKKANLYNNIIDDYAFNKEKEIEYSEEEDMGEHYNYSDESKSAG